MLTSMNYLQTFFLFIILFASLIGQIEGLISGNLTVTPTTVKATGSYYFIVDTNTIIPSGGYLTITFPSDVTLSSSASCSYFFGFSATPTCTVTGNVLKISGTSAFPNQYGMQIQVNYATNPGSAMYLEGFIFKFYKTSTSTTTLDYSTSSAFSQQYTCDTLTAATLTIPSGDYIVGSYETWRLSVTPKNSIPSGGYVKVYFPKWNTASLYSTATLSMLSSGTNTCTVVSGLSSSSLSCTFAVDSISTNLDTLTISNAFSSAQSAGVSFIISIANVHNMPTTRPYTTFAVRTYDANSYGIDENTAITVTMTTAATLPSSQVSISVDAPTTIDALTQYLFQIFVNNPVPSGGRIRIKIPSTLGVTSLTTVSAQQRINSAVTITQVTSGSNYDIYLTGGYPAASDSVPIAGLIAFYLQYLNNPSTTTTTSSFYIATYDSTYIIEEISTSLTVKATKGTITMNSLTYSEKKVLEQNAISLDFTLVSQLQSGCTLVVIIPTEFTCSTVTTASCTLNSVSGLTAGYTCALASNTLTIYSPFGSTTSSGGERVKFTIPSSYVQNPSSTRPTTTGIKVQSVSQLSNTIDSYTASKFTAIVNSFSSVEITPSSWSTGYYPTTLTFKILTLYTVEKNAIIVINLPDEFSVYNDDKLEDNCALQLTLEDMVCKVKNNKITITKGFTSTKCTCTSYIKFTIPYIVNPRSLAETGNVEVYFNTYDGYQIYENTTGTFTMTTVNTKTNITITQEKAQNGITDNYLFTVKNFNMKTDGDYIIVNAPTDISFTSKTLCAARTNLKGISSCTYVSSQKMKLTFAFKGRILDERMLDDLAGSKGFAFLLMNIKNPLSFKPTGTFSFQTYTSTGYQISSISVGPLITNKYSGNFTSLLLKPGSYKWGSFTNLTITFIPQNYMQYMTMQIKLPTDFPITQSKTTLCQSITTYSVNPSLFCDYFTTNRTIKIFNVFTLLSETQYNSYSTNLQKMSFALGNFLNPTNKTKSGNFSFYTYDQYGYLIDFVNATVSFVCSSTCGSCESDDYSQCTTCNQSSSLPYLYLGTCVSSCPTGTTLTNGKCLVCGSSCSECSVDDDTCKTCANGYYNFNGGCLYECPTGYLNSSDGYCYYPIQGATNFVQYFQSNEKYKCYLFIFSWASIVTTMVIFFIAFFRQILLQRRQKSIQRKIQSKKAKQKDESDYQYKQLRVIELCISFISFIEIFGWIFFLICTLQVQDQISMIVICCSIGLNLILNIIMLLKILKDKQNDCDHTINFIKQHSQMYKFIKILSVIVSHKCFYMVFSTYQANQNQKKFYYSYNYNRIQRGFFLTSILLVEGSVIIACILNLLNSNLDQALYCLDIDIIALTVYQSILIIITLITCKYKEVEGDIKTKSKKHQKRQNPNKIDNQSPNKKDKKSNSSKQQQSKNDKYMKSINMDSDEEDFEQIDSDISNTSQKVNMKGNRPKSKKHQVTDNSHQFSNSSSLHNTSTNAILSNKPVNKEVIKREQALKSIINNVRKKGIHTIDGEDDFEEEFSQFKEDKITIKGEDVSHMYGSTNKKNKFNNYEENRSHTRAQNNHTAFLDESTINHTLTKINNRTRLVDEDDYFQDSNRIVNTEKSQNSVHLFNEESNNVNTKNKTQRLTRDLNDSSVKQIKRKHNFEESYEENDHTAQQVQLTKPVYDQIVLSENTQQEVLIIPENKAHFKKQTDWQMQMEEQILEQDNPVYSQIDYQNSMSEQQIQQTDPYYSQINYLNSMSDQQVELNSDIQKPRQVEIDNVMSAVDDQFAMFEQFEKTQNSQIQQENQIKGNGKAVTQEDQDIEKGNLIATGQAPLIKEQMYKTGQIERIKDSRNSQNRNFSGPKSTKKKETKSGINSDSNEEELKDQVNKDDIKPKRNVIFSDKSESSVEEMMEDTPSNYNIPNGRLDENSSGLRSMLYKSIAKKFLYQENGLVLPTAREDQESQNITRKNSDKATIQRVNTQLLNQNKKFDNEKEMMFVKNLVKQQEENLIKGKIDTLRQKDSIMRKSSIGEISPAELEANPLYNRNKTPMRKL